ncbi:MAG: hypothetical protein OEY33_07605 [Bdellovibrionales bacterium]|nr:hypothetical protein [Bdellovibrionales bacterium]
MEKLLTQEDGQTSTEYIMLLAVVALLVFNFRAVAVSKLSQLLDGLYVSAEEIVDAEMGQ